MTTGSYGGCDIDKLLARGLVAVNCYGGTEEPETGKGFYRCTAGHMHEAFTMAIAQLHGPDSPYWSDGTRVLDSFGLDPAFHEAFEMAWEAAEAQTGGYRGDGDLPCIQEQHRLFVLRMTAMGYGDVLNDPETTRGDE